MPDTVPDSTAARKAATVPPGLDPHAAADALGVSDYELAGLVLLWQEWGWLYDTPGILIIRVSGEGRKVLRRIADRELQGSWLSRWCGRHPVAVITVACNVGFLVGSALAWALGRWLLR